MTQQALARSSKNPKGQVTDIGHTFVQLDTVASVADSMYYEFKEPLYAAPPLLQRMVDAGRLGRKTGSGFYPYQ